MDNRVTGGTIRFLRNKKGLTQKQLADLINVSDKTVSKWETGKGFPDVSMIEPLSGPSRRPPSNCLTAKAS